MKLRSLFQNKKRMESEYKKNDVERLVGMQGGSLCKLYTNVDNSSFFPTVFLTGFLFRFTSFFSSENLLYCYCE